MRGHGVREPLPGKGSRTSAYGCAAAGGNDKFIHCRGRSCGPESAAEFAVPRWGTAFVLAPASAGQVSKKPAPSPDANPGVFQ